MDISNSREGIDYRIFLSMYNCVLVFTCLIMKYPKALIKNEDIRRLIQHEMFLVMPVSMYPVILDAALGLTHERYVSMIVLNTILFCMYSFILRLSFGNLTEVNVGEVKKESIALLITLMLWPILVRIIFYAMSNS